MPESSKNFSPDKIIKTVDLGVRETSTGGAPKTPGTQPEQSPNPNRKGLIVKIIGGAVVGLIAAGSIFGIAEANSHGTKPAKATETSAPSNTPKPTHSETAPSGPSIEQLIANAEVKDNSDPKVLSQDIITQLNAWESYGSDTVVADYTAEVRKTADASDATKQKFVESYSKKAESIYAPALFGKDYASNDSIKSELANFATIDQTVLINDIATQDSQDPYKRSIQFESVAQFTPSSSLTINIEEVDNSGTGENSVSTSNGVNGIKGTLGFSYKVVDGVIAIQKTDFNRN